MKDRLSKLLSQPLTGPYWPDEANQFERASILFLIAPSVQGPCLLITKRSENLSSHKGQYSFPGGVQDLGESSIQTALRELSEETGISSAEVDWIGSLPEVWTPTGYRVACEVGLLKLSVESVVLKLNPAEVSEAHWIKFEDLMNPDFFSTEKREWKERSFETFVYSIGPHRIWGLTAGVIRLFFDAWRNL